MITLTVLYENSPSPEKPELAAAHGLSLHVDFGIIKVLYDFGPDESLLGNASELGINLDDVNAAVLSHGHSDHSGALEAFLNANSIAKVYHGRGAFRPRWTLSGGSPKDIGVPMALTTNTVERLSAVDAPTDLKSLIILPAAPGPYPRPKSNHLRLIGSEGERLPDEFSDELTLALRGENGLVILTGCAHRGTLNIINQVKTYCPNSPISALVGGFHLRDNAESDKEVRMLAKEIARILPNAHIASGHCTGARAAGILAEELGDRFTKLQTGMTMHF